MKRVLLVGGCHRLGLLLGSLIGQDIAVDRFEGPTIEWYDGIAPARRKGKGERKRNRKDRWG